MAIPNILLDIILNQDTNNEDFFDTLKDLSVSEFNLKDVPQTSRVIHYYEKEDLLMSKRESPGAWKKYSTEDVIWLHVIMALREFGLPIEKLKKAKEFILRLSYRNEKAKVKTGILTMMAAAAFTDKYTYYLLFNQNGECKPTNSSTYYRNRFYENKESPYICIPLYGIFSMIHELKYNEPLKEIIITEVEISSQVKKIMDLLLKEDYKELIIEYKDKQPTRVKITKSADVSKKLEMILFERQFLDMKVVKANGKTVSIEKSWIENL